jgi:hypothetical protein
LGEAVQRLAPSTSSTPERVEDSDQDAQTRTSMLTPMLWKNAALPEKPTNERETILSRTSHQKLPVRWPLIEPIVRPLPSPEGVTFKPVDGHVNPPRPSGEIVPVLGQQDSQPRPAQEERQVVQVMIGRVEVRAIFTPPIQEPPKPRPTPTMSLDDYLGQRDGGE